MEKPELITFNELVKYGKEHGANIVNDMPWSFEYKGLPVSHENDECYLVTVLSGDTIRLCPGDVLVTDVTGNIHAI
mgnify:CR=1 FL=1